MVNMSLKIGDTSDRMSLRTRKSWVPAARMTTSASSAQKMADSGTTGVCGSVAVALASPDDMMEARVGIVVDRIRHAGSYSVFMLHQHVIVCAPRTRPFMRFTRSPYMGHGAEV